MAHPSLRLGAATLLASLLVGCSSGGSSDPGSSGPSSSALPTSSGASATVAADDLPPISSADLGFGLALPEGPTSPEIERLSTRLDEAPSSYLIFKDFEQEPPLHELDVVAERGAQPIIAWEPWVWDAGVEQPDYSLDAIASGDHDEVLEEWGRALGEWGKPVTLRFAHEMNGTWYPWGAGVNGNESGDYVAAYRHVHEVVTEAGADNVEWMWSPNSLGPGESDLSGFYPGDDHVDVVGIDGYNWGTSKPWSAWQAPAEIFDATLDNVRDFAPDKPMVLAEVASGPSGGDQGEWASDLVDYVAEQPDVEGFIWFHAKQDVDWRLTDSSLDTLKPALAARD